MGRTEPRAVFLSYASQDVDAARRIAEALRAFGIEAWFDQQELRGGEAWEANIRKQIHDCALFMPVISATTEQRAEGYFRRSPRRRSSRSATFRPIPTTTSSGRCPGFRNWWADPGRKLNPA